MESAGLGPEDTASAPIPALAGPDEALRPHYAAAAAALPPGTRWFDVHTHTGQDDPDGMHASAEEIVAALDMAGHDRALIFPFQEPGGYPPANDRVLAEAEASGGRLVALARLDPKEDPIPEARRCLLAGARGFKLHPRAEGFTMSHPRVDEILALADEHRVPVIIHAGRGIPALGEDTATLARRYPNARVILAHAGISDLAWIWRDAGELPNLFFDTAWWSIADLLALFALVPPGQILYGSDLPYGTGLFNGLLALRAGLAVGHSPETMAEVVGGQVARLVEGDDPKDLGPALGRHELRRGLAAERALAQLYSAVGRGFGGSDPSEPLALARLACEVPPDDPEAPLLRAVRGLIGHAEDALEEGWVVTPVPLSPQVRAVMVPILAAAVLAGTSEVPVAG